VRPIVLDAALGYVQPPSLVHRLPQQQAKGVVSRLFGWGA
jgi:hypothetical protein